MIITRTPFRISFFGGGTDYPGWFTKNGGAVLATTIDKYCYITCRRLPPFFGHKHRIVYSRIENINFRKEIQHPAVRGVFDWMDVSEGLEIHHDGDLPARSGLGSSSSFTVGLINALTALNGNIISKQQLATDAIHVEQKIVQEHVGSQDQVSASFGGLNRIDFKTDESFEVSPVLVNKRRKDALSSHLMLFFTGYTRIASDIAISKVKNFDNKSTDLRQMKEMVGSAVEILQDEKISIDCFGELLGQAWSYKRGLSDKVSNPAIDEIYRTALSAGAIGGKLLGAGGGGFILFFVRPQNQSQVLKALKGLVHVPFSFDSSGSKVVLYQPDGL